MKVLITGITGFIGHHLGERLVNNGHEVLAIVRPTSKIAELSDNLRRNVKFYTCDENHTVMNIMSEICNQKQGGGWHSQCCLSLGDQFSERAQV